MKKNKVKKGDILYITHGVGQMILEAVKVKSVKDGIATVMNFNGSLSEVRASYLLIKEELIQEVYNFIQNKPELLK